jgi:hypothetical protein
MLPTTPRTVSEAPRQEDREGRRFFSGPRWFRYGAMKEAWSVGTTGLWVLNVLA